MTTEFFVMLPQLDGAIGAAIGAGGAVGASALTLAATLRRDSQRLAAEFLAIYMKNVHGHHAAALEGLRGGSYEACLVGNWFEMFAALMKSNLANRRVVRGSGLEEQMREFWQAALAAHEGGGPIDPAREWPHLRRVAT